ncbi:beta-mannosidase [Saccharothrix sp. NRRL B-16348]|uniref:cellulase family glycosylhydrolase n=1 Tax=Saccharothrix sp. NRRL B-16348 TaxID=1415542 RepID=UPI0006AE1333|nr:cellulase family glycosylhydrolase [Saccharothrix sp. NRRL B-16348]KOX20422.1 beta-mannosidase [Saccharothrix sp. NRRL B-16348]
MRSRIAMIAAALLVVAGFGLTVLPQAQAAVGLHVSGTKIVEANGQPFVMRGVNHPHVWYTGRTDSFADVKALGANTVRVVLGTGKRWGPSNDVPAVIDLCKRNRMICVLEVHDTTGYGEEAAAASLDEAADYWISQKNALVGQEDYVVINIGNEPIGNVDAAQWTGATAGAIKKLRANGFQHLLMVDAPNWGQDWQHVMRDNAQAVLDADSARNTVLSIHMYSVYNTAATITDYLDRVQAKGWPLVIGEFGWKFASGEVDHDTILSESEKRGLGYLAWSWSGNSDPILDMATEFDPARLTTWGERIFNGANGIKATAKEASIFGGTQPTSTTTTTTTTTTPGGGLACTARYTVTNQWPGGFQGEVRVTAGTSAIKGWTVTWTFADGQTVNHAWNASVTSSGSTVTARNASYNGNLGAGASASFGFTGSSGSANNAPTASCTAS